MKKSYLYLAAAVALASCANDDYVGGENTPSTDTTPIAFNMNTPATSRADQETGATAANTLGNEFIVWGEKNETNGGAASAENLVFQNYRVQYVENTANTTTSNTKNWEYVGIAPYASGVTPSITTTNQTIKYWDLGKSYTFTAVSALQSDITDGKVTIVKTQLADDQKGKGYVITLKNGADASKVFVADRLDNVTRTAPTAGQTVDPVTLAFRNFQTKVRFGFYETVPGYNVQITGVKYNSATTASATAFGVDGQFVKSPTSDDQTVTYTVTYDTNNKPVVTVATTGASTTAGYAEFGDKVFNTNLATASNAPTYDKENGAYTCILPNTGNQTNMTFKVSYKLISEDTKEEIEVTDKEVTVPAVYCQWKPNFAYTYLFKVSDKSAELYPITFDAVVESDEVSQQETITEVGEPSITTIAFKDGKVVTSSSDEYATGSTIYATTNATTGMTSENTALYTVTATAGIGAAPVISEASVANCLAKMTASSNVWTATDATGGKLEVTKVTTSDDNFVTSVPAEDGGTARTINALTWTPSTAATYAVEYTVDDNKYYKIVVVK